MLTKQIIGTPEQTPNLSLKRPAFSKAEMFLKGPGTTYSTIMSSAYLLLVK